MGKKQLNTVFERVFSVEGSSRLASSEVQFVLLPQKAPRVVRPDTSSERTGNQILIWQSTDRKNTSLKYL